MRILVVRLGAYGDVIITTPLVRKLHEDGHEIIYLTSERGMDVLKHNPRIKKLILHHKDSVAIDKLDAHIAQMAKKHQCERTIDLSESIEVALSLHPRSPEYNLPKFERRRLFERNYYEYTMQLGGYTDLRWDEYNPELYFEEKELEEARSYLRPGCFNILVGMSGSGSNKAWPWTEPLVGSILNEYRDAIHVITVGDKLCQIIEPTGPHITNLSGKVGMRISMALTGLVQCVITPDTGLLHASGCYPTPKLGLLGHNTREVLTKHFDNDYSVEADEARAECAPCFRLVYNMKLQCPVDNVTGGAYCMSRGIQPETVLAKFKELYAKSQ